MAKYKFHIFINGENISANDNVLRLIMKTTESLEQSNSSFKDNCFVSMFLPEGNIFNHIAEVYKTLYSRNYEVVVSDNAAKSLANKLKNAQDEYVTIINAGDSLSPGALDEVYDYFSYAKGAVDIVGVKIQSNDKKYNAYNSMFGKKSQTVHLLESYKGHPQNTNGLFIKSNVVRANAQKLNSCFNMKTFIINCVNRRKNLGILSSENNIKTFEKESMVLTAELLERMSLEYKKLLEDIVRTDKFVPSYVQDFIIQDLIYCFENTEDIMGEYDHPSYDYSETWNELSNVLKYIDNDIIINQSTTRYRKLFFLSIKNGEHCYLDKHYNDVKMYYSNTTTYLLSSFPVRFELMNITDGVLRVEGLYMIPAGLYDRDYEVVAIINNVTTSIENIDRHSDRYYLEKVYLNEKGFKLEIALTEEIYSIKIGVKFDDVVCVSKKCEFMELCTIGSELKDEYYYRDGYSVQADNNSLICKQCSEDERAELEKKLQAAILKNEGKRASELIELRKYYWENCDKKEKQIWLFTDRPDRADDNAEAFFRYMCEQNDNNIDCYFILQQDCHDYERLSMIGKVVEPFSEEHLRLHIMADYIISSQMTQAVFQPFNDDIKYFRDLFRNAKQIFLQHGITDKNQGKTMGKYGRDFYGLITAVKAEHDYFISDPKFHYTEDNIWLTGFPRFDYLVRDDKKKITIMPTWRKYLTTRMFDEKANTRIWKVNDNFEESDYFKFYNELINDTRLLDSAEEYGYKICFMPHPIFLNEVDKFKHNSRTIIYDYEKNYKEIYAESSLIVTDYSSAAFDFAYLDCPVVYCQFDHDYFWKNHVYKKGYFEHERDGFGEVTYSVNETVDTLIDYMANSCQLKPLYKDRISKFFTFHDRKSCERLYKKILDLENEK